MPEEMGVGNEWRRRDIKRNETWTLLGDPWQSGFWCLNNDVFKHALEVNEKLLISFLVTIEPGFNELASSRLQSRRWNLNITLSLSQNFKRSFCSWDKFTMFTRFIAPLGCFQYHSYVYPDSSSDDSRFINERADRYIINKSFIWTIVLKCCCLH